MSKIDYLLELINNKTSLKNITGDNKKAYKYIISGIFINILNGQDHEYFQRDLYVKAEYILSSSKAGAKITKEGLYQISSGVKESMKQNFILDVENPETTTKIISFLREKLREIKNGKTLFQAVEIYELVDIGAFMRRKGTPYLHKHHWLDFSFENGLTHTTPVFILMGDLKIHWNNYIDLINKYREYQKNLLPKISQQDFDKIVEIREIRHSYSGIYRTLIFTAVTFVEAYLLEVFINIKRVYPEEQEKHKALLNETTITDKEIINNVIYKIFPDIKLQVNKYFEIYKEILNYRDRYVHASIIKEEHTNISKLQYLLDYDADTVKKYLVSCINLVKGIDDFLPKEIQSLYWWDRVEFPNFITDTKISLLSTVIERKKLSDYGL
ncbi:hypothetical protein [Cytobacillus firmus]|uniref:hypothetical protein n=1 Tax=Cytobacillus firmus TaxID=1399 RepID=UPI001C9528AB|nr:hypothetical protein [Cytobacillus firmus]MBY6053314.1 hypothetical protein [Cytobacillus firmus]